MVGVEPDKRGYELARQSYPDIQFYNFGVQDDPHELVSKEGAFDLPVEKHGTGSEEDLNLKQINRRVAADRNPQASLSL